MVTRLGHYYNNPFKGHQGFTHEDPLSPTIFNMVVDAVIFYWVTLVAGEESVTDGFEQAFKWLAAFFYVNDVLLKVGAMLYVK